MSERLDDTTRTEIIDLFNERIQDRTSFVDMFLQGGTLTTMELQYEVEISNRNVGHGALVLVALDDYHEEALPFALNPKYAQNFDEDNFKYGFHRHVAREASKKLGGQRLGHDFTLNMWRTADDRIVAKPYGVDDMLTESEIDAIRRLSKLTPEVTYASKDWDNQHPIKIAEGVVLTRPNLNAEWVDLAR